jgi:DNA-binding beta-propeller fold protein YncE
MFDAHAPARRLRTALAVPAALLSLGLACTPAHAALSPIPASPIGGPGTGEGQFSHPAGVDVNPATDNVYVADTGNNRVQVFDADGTFVSMFGWGVNDGAAALQTCTSGCEAGSAGGGDGQLSSPAGIAVDPSSGDVYVGSADDGRIARFNADGTFVQTLGTFGLPGPYDTMAFAPSGLLYVATPGQILGFDAAGVPQPDFLGYAFGAIAADFDSAGRMYVSDTNGSLAGLHVFDSIAGEILPQLLPLAAPSAVTVDRSSNSVLVVQPGDVGDNASHMQMLKPNGDVLVGDFAAGTVQSATASAYNPNAALPGTEGGAYYVLDAVADRLVVLSSVSAAPRLGRPSVLEVGAREAKLRAIIDPNYRSTTYRIELGRTTDYGTAVPVAPAAVGGDGVEHRITTSIDDLEPQTTYHYRVVATNALGTTRSADRTFSTDPLGAALRLPDNRAWEQVSPVDKSDNEPQNAESGGGTAAASSLASPAGGALAYGIVGAFPGAAASTRFNVARSIRGPLDWSTTAMDPAIDPPAGLATGSVRSVSTDLSHSVVVSSRALTPDAVAGEGHFYLRDNTTGDYRLLASNPDPLLGEVSAPNPVIGGSDSFDHVVLFSWSALTPDATDGTPQVYDWTAASGLRLVPGSNGVGYGNEYGHPVAAVGRRFVYFGTDGALYLRDNATSTQIGSPSAIRYWGMSRDGSKILLSSNARLTPEASGDRIELYRYDVATSELETVTAGLDFGNAGDPQQVISVQAVSQDGETVVFTGQALGGPGGSASSSPKLYVLRNGAAHLITTTPFEYRRQQVAVSPSGRYLVLTTSNELTDQPTGGLTQVFRYDADTHQAVCISCRPSGVSSASAASLNLDSASFAEPGQLRNVLDDGRAFFQTKDPLVSSDSNGRQDVYEWSDGRPWLISDGTSDTDSYFADASADGTDVFFTTRARLVGRDRDDYVDVYDARVGGGLASQADPPATPPCAGEACQGSVPFSPTPPVIGSISFLGSGSDTTPARTPKNPKVRVSTAKTVKGSSAKVKVVIPAAGTVTVAGSDVRTSKRAARRAGTYTVTVSLTKSARQRLARKRSLKVSVRMRFTPKSGAASSVTVGLTFKKPAAKTASTGAGAGAGSGGKRS